MKLKLVCLRCRKKFEEYPSQKRKYCCWDCAHPPFFNKCLRCSKSFRISPALKFVKYCSKKCRYSGTNFDKKCGFCGKLFVVRACELKVIKYCSKVCRYNDRNNWMNIKTGKESPSWKGGRTNADRLERNRFRQTIQKEIFKRDNYTCQMCNKRGCNLQVDHIQPWADYIGGRFDMNNCRTLCVDCHYFITYGRKKPSGLTWGLGFKYVERELI